MFYGLFVNVESLSYLFFDHFIVMYLSKWLKGLFQDLQCTYLNVLKDEKL